MLLYVRAGDKSHCSIVCSQSHCAIRPNTHGSETLRHCNVHRPFWFLGIGQTCVSARTCILHAPFSYLFIFSVIVRGRHYVMAAGHDVPQQQNDALHSRKAGRVSFGRPICCTKFAAVDVDHVALIWVPYGIAPLPCSTVRGIRSVRGKPDPSIKP